MPEHLLISPDLDLLKEYQEAAGGNIRYITVSPEVKGVPESIKGMIDLGMKLRSVILVRIMRLHGNVSMRVPYQLRIHLMP